MPKTNEAISKLREALSTEMQRAASPVPGTGPLSPIEEALEGWSKGLGKRGLSILVKAGAIDPVEVFPPPKWVTRLKVGDGKFIDWPYGVEVWKEVASDLAAEGGAFKLGKAADMDTNYGKIVSKWKDKVGEALGFDFRPKAAKGVSFEDELAKAVKASMERMAQALGKVPSETLKKHGISVGK